MVVVPLHGDGADLGVEGSIIVFEDVTSRARLEEQLQISDKMASIGLLAAGVAHEVNTPLTGISSYTQMLLDRADPEDPQTKLLEKIERQTFRAAKIVNGLLTLARGGQSANERAPVDLNTVINDVLSLLDTGRTTSRSSHATSSGRSARSSRGFEVSAAVFKNPVQSGRFLGQDWRRFAPWVQY